MPWCKTNESLLETMPLLLLWVESLSQINPDEWSIILGRSADDYLTYFFKLFPWERWDPLITDIKQWTSDSYISKQQDRDDHSSQARQTGKRCEVRSQFAAHATMNQRYASITSRSTDSTAGQRDSSMGHDSDWKFVQSPRPHSHTVLTIGYCLIIVGITMINSESN